MGRRQSPRRGKKTSSTSGSKKKSPPDFEPLHLTTHRDLIDRQPELFQRFNDHPELANLLLINPVLAFKEVGVTMSREIAHHVLHTRQHPPRQRQRRDELEAKLTEALGEKPQPENEAWNSRLLFKLLKLKPLATRGRRPEYQAPMNTDAIKRLEALRPKRQRRDKTDRQSGSFIRVNIDRPAVRRLDLSAELPKLKPAKRPPKTVSLNTLYFYKDSHPLVRDVLELGMIKARSFPVHSGDSYRQIKSGKKRNAFRTWISSVRFPIQKSDESDG